MNNNYIFKVLFTGTSGDKTPEEELVEKMPIMGIRNITSCDFYPSGEKIVMCTLRHRESLTLLLELKIFGEVYFSNSLHNV